MTTPQAALEQTTCRRVNVGCGDWPLQFFINIDQEQFDGVQLCCRVPPLPFGDGSLTMVWASHFLEHLERDEANEFVREAWRCLEPGGRLGVVVPDTREIMRRYVNGLLAVVEYPEGQWLDGRDLDDVCALFVYSTIQDSRHRWMYDERTLERLLCQHGFGEPRPLDRYQDMRIPVGAWYQFGIEARKL